MTHQHSIQAASASTTHHSGIQNGLKILWNARKLIALCLAACTVIALAMALFTKPVYKAESVLMLYDETEQDSFSTIMSQLGGLASFAAPSFRTSSYNLESYMAMLKSRHFIDRFIHDNHIKPVLFAKLWDANKQQWKKDKEPTAWKTYKTFNKKFSIVYEKRTGLVRIAIEDHDPKIAAAWVNAMVTTFNQHIRSQTIAQAEKSIDFIQKQIRETSVVDMREALYRIIEQQMQKITLAEARDDFAFTVIDPAVVPEDKSRPNRKLILLLGIMSGLMLGIFLVFIQNLVAFYFPGFKLSQLKDKIPSRTNKNKLSTSNA